MAKMIHASRLHILIDNKDSKGVPIPFSITYRKMNGVLVHATNVVCTSWFSNGNTMNIKYLTSGSVRTIRRILVFSINDIKIYQ